MCNLDDRTRCAKFYIMITGNCKDWLLVFVRGRIPSNLSLMQYISKNKQILTDPFIKKTYNKMQTDNSDSADISCLWRIVDKGSLLKPNEQLGRSQTQTPTIGDQIDNIRLLRNDFMHIDEPSLTEPEYRAKLRQVKQLAIFFEDINGCSGKYVKEIDEIVRKLMTPAELETTITGYKTYVELVYRYEMPRNVGSASYTTAFASAAANVIDNPIGHAIGGLIGGGFGFMCDVLTIPGLDFLTPHIPGVFTADVVRQLLNTIRR